jgi:hypothetical protein
MGLLFVLEIVKKAMNIFVIIVSVLFISYVVLILITMYRVYGDSREKACKNAEMVKQLSKQQEVESRRQSELRELLQKRFNIPDEDWENIEDEVYKLIPDEDYDVLN